MTNEEKSKKISWIHHKEYWYEGCDGGEYYNDSVGECEASAMEMAEWKDGQFDKVCDWLRETNIDGLSDSKNLTSYFIKKLREIYNN